MFVKTFKGYEDKTMQLDHAVNEWIQRHSDRIKVVDIKTVLSHEDQSRAGSGDLLFTVLYHSQDGAPIDD